MNALSGTNIPRNNQLHHQVTGEQTPITGPPDVLFPDN
jgi:hypothetical protein